MENYVKYRHAQTEEVTVDARSNVFDGPLPPDSADTTAINAKGRVKVIGATTATKDFLNDGKTTENFFVGSEDQQNQTFHQGSKNYLLASSGAPNSISENNATNNT